MIVLANDILQHRGITECATMLFLVCTQDDAGLSFDPEAYLRHRLCVPDGRTDLDYSISAQMLNARQSSLNIVPRGIDFASVNAKQRPVQHSPKQDPARPFSCARKVV